MSSVFLCAPKTANTYIFNRKIMAISFKDLNLSDALLTALTKAGYQTPTEIQIQAIPAALENKDLLASAQTGSGKTAAFILPSLERISKKSEKQGKGPRILVLTPTRELAQQVEKNATAYGENLKYLRTVSLVGGSPMGFQIRVLAKPVDLVVATPGRLMDHMRRGRIDFNRLEVLILDEADRMLDMGFIEDIETIVKATPADRQTMLFSATLDGVVGKLAARLTRDPVRIEIARKEEDGKIEEQLLYCDDFRHKERLLDHILRDANINQCVIFTATKSFSEELSDRLYEKGFSSACLHGDMPQSWRNRTLNDLRLGRIKILVATDVAARGIDVPTITHVINYDLPNQAEDYVHRIGRTGRAGRTGYAIAFAEVNEHMKVQRIERYIARKLEETVIEGMEPTRKRKAPSERRRGKGFGGGKSFGSGNASNTNEKSRSRKRSGSSGGNPNKGKSEFGKSNNFKKGSSSSAAGRPPRKNNAKSQKPASNS